jgi:hypothetical protein
MGIKSWLTGPKSTAFQDLDALVRDTNAVAGLSVINNQPSLVQLSYSGSRKDGYILMNWALILADPIDNTNYRKLQDPLKSGKVLDAFARLRGYGGESLGYVEERRYGPNFAQYVIKDGFDKAERAMIEVNVDDKRQDPANPAALNPNYGKVAIIYKQLKPLSGNQIANDLNRILGVLRRNKALFELRQPGQGPQQPITPGPAQPTPTP